MNRSLNQQINHSTDQLTFSNISKINITPHYQPFQPIPPPPKSEHFFAVTFHFNSPLWMALCLDTKRGGLLQTKDVLPLNEAGRGDYSPLERGRMFLRSSQKHSGECNAEACNPAQSGYTIFDF